MILSRKIYQFEFYHDKNDSTVIASLRYPLSTAMAYIEKLIEKSSLSVDLLNRMQYEIITEELVDAKGYKSNSVEKRNLSGGM